MKTIFFAAGLFLGAYLFHAPTKAEVDSAFAYVSGSSTVNDALGKVKEYTPTVSIHVSKKGAR